MPLGHSSSKSSLPYHTLLHPNIYNCSMDDIESLLEFLYMPLDSTKEIFTRFSKLKGVIHRGIGRQQFLYRPGTRKDRVLLVAHADTVFFGNKPREIAQEEGVIRNRLGGLGADDRAGCAILWLLRDLGHSLIVTDGEELGGEGSRWLRDANQDIFDEINNRHRFVLEFDRRNGRDFKCYRVGTPEFRKYIREMTNYKEPDQSSFTDICLLCGKVPGANLSIGFRNEHSNLECLVVSEWQHTLDLCRQWLSGPKLPRFRIPKQKKIDYFDMNNRVFQGHPRFEIDQV